MRVIPTKFDDDTDHKTTKLAIRIVHSLGHQFKIEPATVEVKGVKSTVNFNPAASCEICHDQTHPKSKCGLRDEKIDLTYGDPKARRRAENAARTKWGLPSDDEFVE